MIPVIGLLIIVAVLAYAWGHRERSGRGAQAARLGRAMSYRYVQAKYDSYGNRTATKALVVHMTEGSGTEADVDYLANNPLRGVSVHFVILKTGEIVQMLGWGRIAGSINPNELRTTDDPPYTSPDGARVVYGATLRDAIMGSWINGGLLAVEVGGKAVDGPNQAQSEALVRLGRRRANTLSRPARARSPRLHQHQRMPRPQGAVGLARRARQARRSPQSPGGSDGRLDQARLDRVGRSAVGLRHGDPQGRRARPHLGRHVAGRRHEHARRLLAGLVEKGTLAKATGWGAVGEAVVTYNVDGVQAVSPLAREDFVPTPTTTAVKCHRPAPVQGAQRADGPGAHQAGHRHRLAGRQGAQRADGPAARARNADLVRTLATYAIAVLILLGAFVLIYTAKGDPSQSWLVVGAIVGYIFRDSAGAQATANVSRINASAQPSQVVNAQPADQVIVNGPDLP
jgi:hypothetical protein